jgi:hypothetical protein
LYLESSVVTLLIITSIPKPSNRFERILLRLRVSELAALGHDLELLLIVYGRGERALVWWDIGPATPGWILD